jgi:hypothetical protein
MREAIRTDAVARICKPRHFLQRQNHGQLLRRTSVRWRALSGRLQVVVKKNRTAATDDEVLAGKMGLDKGYDEARETKAKGR